MKSKLRSLLFSLVLATLVAAVWVALRSPVATSTPAVASATAAEGGDARGLPDFDPTAVAASQHEPATPVRVRRPAALVFGVAGPVTFADVPDGRFKDELLQLNTAAQQRVLATLERLRVPLHDVNSLFPDAEGGLAYACQLPPPPQVWPELQEYVLDWIPDGSVPISAPPVFHSRPGASKVLYLDFNGHDIVGTAWNAARGSPGDANYRPAVSVYAAVPFDTDGSPELFGTAEQQAIHSIWRRVAEDFAGFDVDVTTEEPAGFGPTVARVLITRSVDANGANMPSHTAAGVAYLSVFGLSDFVSRYSPALVYFDRLYFDSKYIAEVASHEAGHNLSLTHDGTTTAEYYSGHGSGATSWAPIMGSSASALISQWSKGEYFAANNPQDDLALLAGHLGYVPDDVGDDATGAVALTASNGQFSGRGVLERSGDSDRFSFTSAGSAVRFTVTPTAFPGGSDGGNAAVRLELRDAADEVVTTSAPDAAHFARAVTIETVLPAGDYHLRVSATGVGNPLASPFGYTVYGSVGQYEIAGAVFTPVAPQVTMQPWDQLVRVGQTATFQASATGTPAPGLRWQRLVAGGSEWIDLADGDGFSGTGTSMLSIVATLAMHEDQFRCRFSNAGGAAVSQSARLRVTPALPPQVYNNPPLVAVEHGATLSFSASVAGTSPFTFVWRRNGEIVANATSAYFSKSNVTADDAGTYVLTVTNAAGTATSGPTNVVVGAPVAPAVFGLPQIRQLAYGGSLSLSPTITGSQPRTIQWHKDGEPIAGATSSSFSRWSVTPEDAGIYTVSVTNVVGTVTSLPVSVTVAEAIAPSVYGIAASQLAAHGGTLSVSPVVTGTAPFTYQWRRNGEPISGATGSSFYRSNLTTADAGTYTVTVTNAVGAVTSSGLVLTVLDPVAPRFSVAGTSIVIEHGAYLSISPGVSGSLPMTYQWRRDGEVLTGATSSSFTKNPATAADNGVYTLTVTNAGGTATTGDYVVTVRPPLPPYIAQLPATVAVSYGQSFQISAQVFGTSPMTYRWRRNEQLLASPTSPTFSVSQATLEHAGIYMLTASNPYGSATSTPVNVLIDDAVAPELHGYPESVEVPYNGTLSLSGNIFGSQPRTVRWRKDGTLIANATAASYIKYNVTPADSGTYTVSVTNDAGTATSQAINVTVQAPIPPSVYLPQAAHVNPGSSLSISAQVTGSSPFTYQWRRNGTTIPGATGQEFYRSSVTASDAGNYTVVVTNAAGSVTSSPCEVVVRPAVAPAVNGLPSTLVVPHGETLSISPSYSGTTPMTYQWSRDGVAIPSATSSTLVRSSTTAADTGSYTVTVTNSAGTVTSAAVAVTIEEPVLPGIVNLPTVRAMRYGESLSVYVSVSGTRPMTYQWRKDGVDIGAAIHTDFYRSNVTTADAGIYTLVVSNAAGTTSASMELLISEPEPPRIHGLSGDQTIDYGASVSFSPTVTGTAPLTFEWRRDDEPVGSQSSYYLNYAETKHTGSYTLTVTNAFGTTTSVPFYLTVRPANPPTITQQPQGLVASVGHAATLSVAATGTSPMTYRWFLNGALLSEGSSNQWSRSSLQADDFGIYHVVVVNPGGSARSVDAIVALDSGLPVLMAAAGQEHSAWIRADHSLWTTGEGSSGQLGTGSTARIGNARRIAEDVTFVAAAGNSTFFIKKDATLWAMGANGSGQLGLGHTTSVSVPVQVAAEVAKVFAGSSTTFFLKTDGTLWAMGANASGQFGNGTTTSSLLPLQVSTEVVDVAVGQSHALFLKQDGTLRTAGANHEGQLGDGTNTARATPVKIADAVVSVAAGSHHSAFVDAEGALWTFGQNYVGQLGNENTSSQRVAVNVATDVVSVMARGSVTYFRTADGMLHGMGENYYGQMGTNSYSIETSPVPVASAVREACTGGQHLLIVRPDGSLWGLGRSYSGEFGIGLTTSSTAVARRIIAATATAPVIVAQPESRLVMATGATVFSVTAVSSIPLTYQWRRDGADLPGSTAATLALPAATAAHAGDYDVVIANVMGSVISDPARLTVQRLDQFITFAPLADRAPGSMLTPLQAEASSGLPVSFRIVSGSATLVGSSIAVNGPGRVIVVASQSGDDIYAAAPEVERGFTVGTTLAVWREQHFSPAELQDEAISGAAADPDGDGYSNLVEYALGRDPKVAGAAPFAEVAASAGEWTFVYSRPADRTDVSYTVEISTNLTTWTTANVIHERVAEGATETWRARAPLSAGANVFFRLRVSRPADRRRRRVSRRIITARLLALSACKSDGFSSPEGIFVHATKLLGSMPRV